MCASALRRSVIALLALAFSGVPLGAQEASRGIVVPFTLSGGFMVSDRPLAADPGASPVSVGFRSVAYPSFRINSRWFAYSALQVNSEPFFYYESFYPGETVKTRVQQLYLGYSRVGEEAAFTMKVGQLPAAFGSFPLRYDDNSNPLLDQPFSYAYPVRLRPDQLPCGTNDLVHQSVYPAYVNHYCGGSTEQRNGMVPTTLYGLPGVEINFGSHRVDARLQLTNSSPVNPQGLTSDSQHVQWTAGGGYTIRQGFRIGVSGFRGAFLEQELEALLDPGTTVNDYPAAGFGGDLEWGAGRWSVNAELQQIRFNYPGFMTSPALSTGYLEIKTTLNPRFYAAFRGGFEDYGLVEDDGGTVSNSFLPDRQSYEVALGYRLNRFQSLKFGYEWLKTAGSAGTRDNVFGVQFVTSIYSLSRAF